MNESHVFGFFQEYASVIERFGPFEYIDDSELDSLKESFVWSQAEVDDGIHLINGLQQGPAVDHHLRGSHQCDEASFTLDVFEVFVFECEECDEDGECAICEGEQMLEIDFARFLGEYGATTANEAKLWQPRRPLGFDYS